jgi:hypothetical protein
MNAPLAKDQDVERNLLTDIDRRSKSQDQRPKTLGQSFSPTPQELAVLSWFERIAFRLVRRMNQGRWKRFWAWCQKTVGAGWIHLSTYNLMNVYGLDHIEAASRERPILLVANHRSFFDMYTVSTVLFRRRNGANSFSFRYAAGFSINHR